MKKLFILLTIFLVPTIFSQHADALTVRNLNMRDLSSAKYIFKGTIIDKRNVEEDNLIVTYYTAKISDCIKCSDISGDTFVWKQIGQGEYQGFKQNYGIIEFNVGDKNVFFLSSESEKTGLTAPLGLFQGVFKVKTDSDGSEIVPQLKARRKQLQKGLNGKNSNNSAYLKFQINSSEDDQSYEHFKSLIEAAGE